MKKFYLPSLPHKPRTPPTPSLYIPSIKKPVRAKSGALTGFLGLLGGVALGKLAANWGLQPLN